MHTESKRKDALSRWLFGDYADAYEGVLMRNQEVSMQNAEVFWLKNEEVLSMQNEEVLCIMNLMQIEEFPKLEKMMNRSA
ncbi:unnamed protein product [Lathyrus oleraceus]